jgi:ABC-type branched-subunit amino acid transport system ATPase component
MLPARAQARQAKGMTTNHVAIAVEDLRKTYGDTHAVDGVDLEVDRGEVFALLGPNGAGKTTTVEILEGFPATRCRHGQRAGR